MTEERKAKDIINDIYRTLHELDGLERKQKRVARLARANCAHYLSVFNPVTPSKPFLKRCVRKMGHKKKHRAKDGVTWD